MGDYNDDIWILHEISQEGEIEETGCNTSKTENTQHTVEVPRHHPQKRLGDHMVVMGIRWPLGGQTYTNKT